MTTLQDRVSTVVLVIMENRSFDHVLGHLSLEGLVPGVEGLRAPLAQYQNLYAGDLFSPFKMKDGHLNADLPHEWNFVATQLARSGATGRYTMSGFVEAYASFTGNADPGPFPDPMGFLSSDQLPVTSFLARSFCTCDRWFCPLPTSTQPNRTMAWCGASSIFDTKTQLISGDTLLHWLTGVGVRWRVYHDGLSFFALYPDAWDYVVGDAFRDVENYLHDMQTEALVTGPQVIIVEPSYEDAPHIGPDHPNDNHPPLAMGWGEDFLRRAYEAARIRPDRWEKTVMILYYDEHGGFFDHVPPLNIQDETTDRSHRFESTGPRVPAIIVSPLVAPASVCHQQFDHTSVLQFLAELFTPGKPFSGPVDNRRKQGIASISVALGDAPRPESPPAPSQLIPVATTLGGRTAPPLNDSQKALEQAANALMSERPEETGKKYPELFHWKAAADAARGLK